MLSRTGLLAEGATTGTDVGTEVEAQWSSPYLPPDSAAGCRYALDPDSPGLRAALTGRSPSGDTALDAAALADDLDFLHRLLRQHYAGYPDLLQHPAFDPEAFFAAWIGRVVAAGAGTTFRAGVVEPLVALRLVHPDGHLAVEGAGPLLAAEPRLAVAEYQAPLPAGRPPPVAASLRTVAGAHPGTLRRAPLLRADGSVAEIVTLSATGAGAALRVPLPDGGAPLRLGRRPAAPRRLGRRTLGGRRGTRL